MFQEFKKFIMRGNVMDLAIGVVIGAAFGAIVTSLVNDIIMPVIGQLLAGMSFSDLFVPLATTDATTLKAAKDAGVPVVAYGLFINTLINFLIIAFVIFLVVKGINRIMPAPPPPSPGLTPEEKLTDAVDRLIKVLEKK